MSFKTRIAPTPSGYLHLGNAFNFLLTEQLALANNASVRLRIDDLDAPRIRPEYLTDIFETLAWLGIQWHEGPKNVAEHLQHFSQQQRHDGYNHLLQQLNATGQTFACVCSRNQWMAQSTDGQYPGTCIPKNLPLGTPGAALRIITPMDAIIHFTDALCGPLAINLFKENRHFIVRRADGIPAYHLASMADDLAFGITHIVRGQDLQESTAAQLFLAQTLARPVFQEISFYHHPLIADAAGEKLSKSAGSFSLKALRAAGIQAGEIRQQFAAWRASFEL